MVALVCSVCGSQYGKTRDSPPPGTPWSLWSFCDTCWAKRDDRPNIFDLVRADLAKREQKGTETYGEPLRPFNGRDALWDAMEEALDLVAYLRQAIWERDNPEGK